MKKLFYTATLVALSILAASCQRENLEPVANQTLTYTVALPDAAATKAASEELTLHYEVYRTVEQGVTEFTAADNLLYAKTATFNAAGVATLDLEVVNGQNFTVLFWAQHEGNDVYSWDALTNVKVAQTLTANQTSYEAYAGVDCIKKGEELAGRKVTLTRPVAQLNIATTNASLDSYFDDDITVNESYVKVTGKLATSFNVATLSPAAASDVEFKYESAAVPDGELKTGYKYVAMNYVAFVDEDGENVVVDYILKTSEGDIDNTIGNVPLKPNYRTNIVGNLITASSDYTVTLNEWEDEIQEVEIWDGETLTAPTTNAAGEYVVSKPSEWAHLANQQNPATKADPVPVVINLTSNLDFGGNELTGLVAASNNSLTVKGNGYTIMNARMVSGNNDNGTPCASLFVSLSSSTLTVSDLNVKNVNVVVDQDPQWGYAAVLVAYAEGKVTLNNIKVSNSTVYGTHSIGTAVGFIAGYSSVEINNFVADGIKLSNADVEDESGSMGGFVGRVAGTLEADNVKVSNSTIEAYVATASEQKRSIAKFIGNFVGGGNVNVTGASVENVTIVAKNELAETQQCLYTEYLGGWRGNGGTVSINGIEITKDQTNDDITIDTPAELATAISNAADGSVIPVSGEISTSSLSASGKSITIVGMSDDATINSASARMETYGNITFKNITVTLPTNNDYYGGQDAHYAQIVYDNCKFVGTATAINGTFVYNDCEFTNPDKYAAWVYNGNVTYNNCSFTGKDRAAKVYAEAGNAPVVTYNNCTFNAAQSVNKTAVEIDCTNQTSGTPYYVTIINPTINNMGVAEHFAVGAAGVCNLETSGVGLGIVNVDGKAYSVAHTAAQLEALTNAGKDVTIQFAQDIAGDFTYEQNENETVVIDGNGMTMNGTINVRARAGVDVAIPVVIKNINFQTTDAERSFILSSETNRYPHITVSGCTFEGSGAESGVVPVTIKSAKNFVMENCTATKVHSLIQNTSGWNITIRNCEVTESGRGIALGTVQGATIENVKIDALDTKYGIRMDAGYNNNATIKDCEISAFIPVVVRKASVNSTVVFNGTNTMTPANTDGLWCAIGTSEYEANGVMPTAPTAQVTVTLNDAGLDPAGVYGAANL